MPQKDSSKENSFWQSKRGQFFKPKKKGIFKKLFKRKEKKDLSELRLPSPKTRAVKGKVKEIIVESPLQKKFEQHKGLSLKIPKAKTKAGLVAPKKAEKSREETEKEKRLREKRRGKKLSLLIIPSEEYLKNITVISKQASLKYSKILYISLNELHDNLIRNFEENSIATKNFYFIDAITRTAQTNIQEKENCFFVTSPNSLIELSLVITQKINEMEPDLIIFDSLSTLFIYEKESTAVKFVHSLIGKIKAAGCDSVLTSLEGDAKRKAIKDLGMFVDEFLTMSEYQLRNLKLVGSTAPLIPQATPKEEALKKEMDQLFPQRKEHEKFLPQEKQIILTEMKNLKKNLGAIKAVPNVNEAILRLEKKLGDLERRPVTVDTSKIQQEILSLGKKIEEIKEEKHGDVDAALEGVLNKFNSKMLEIEQRLQEEQQRLVAQEQKLKQQELRAKLASKEKSKIKKVQETRKRAERQVKSLEKKLALLNKSHVLGLISNEAYEKDKLEIERLLKK